MRYVKLFLLFILYSNTLLSQDIPKEDFEIIYNLVRQKVYTIDNDEDFLKLIKDFNLSDNDSKSIKDLINSLDIKFTKSRTTRNHIIPFFKKAEESNRLGLTIFSITVQDKRHNESFQRSKYHFIVTCQVGIDNDKNLIVEKTKLISEEKGINDWFLKGYKTYLKDVKLIADKYSFVPPPPPSPPTSL